MGESAATLNDSAWTMSAVPTLAPSITASAGTSATKPPAASPVTISPVAVLLWSSAVTAAPARNAASRLPRAMWMSRRRSEPNARTMPLWTMCRPHSSSATPPIRSSRMKLAIAG